LKNLIAAGFLFVGGAILMTVTEMGRIVPFLGAACALIGAGLLLYFVFSNNGKYD
jgi:high-affinity Fe2+/Pb2+ permease